MNYRHQWNLPITHTEKLRSGQSKIKTIPWAKLAIEKTLTKMPGKYKKKISN